MPLPLPVHDRGEVAWVLEVARLDVAALDSQPR